MRYELSDHEWTAIKPMLPNKPRGVRRVNNRRVLNGIPIQKSQVPEFSVAALAAGGAASARPLASITRYPPGIGSKSPWSREAALRHGCEDKLRRRWRSIRDERPLFGEHLEKRRIRIAHIENESFHGP